ncbi:phage regulatory protein, rha family [Paenibacillus sophorae]|uniref:Phage regulatory protein, rha family n=1 Tax=Paenibacillus sophorae TaxID=1333845 RepID=A0A1H8VTT8_9BACL|nr:Rha family transcriptional regulator [Paenibacillus sophorae]QWU15709.1 Rha family transcriptional regulator [Paenibacillus sophorae]SEP18801.1 phage regulatory protein, rha family [Paenibacillus sophorae]
MTKLILNTEYGLYAMNDKAVYSSRQVAGEFDKNHYHILRSIDEITESKNGLSDEVVLLLAGQTIEEFYKDNFFEDKYKDASGKQNRQILMTYKGAMLIVMGFTGAKAMAVKIGLLNRFEAMASFISSLLAAKLEHPAFTQAIADSKEQPMHYHFSNEADMINRIVLGMSAKKFREANGIAKGESIRPFLSSEQIKAVEDLQRADIGLLMAGLDFDERKQRLTHFMERMRTRRLPNASRPRGLNGGVGIDS